MGQSSPLAGRPGMLAFTCGGEASALGSTSAMLGCARVSPRLPRGACVRLRSYNWQAGALNAKKEVTPRGFEPLRAEPNGFRVHLLIRSHTLSCVKVLVGGRPRAGSASGTCRAYVGRMRERFRHRDSNPGRSGEGRVS